MYDVSGGYEFLPARSYVWCTNCANGVPWNQAYLECLGMTVFAWQQKCAALWSSYIKGLHEQRSFLLKYLHVESSSIYLWSYLDFF